MQLTAIHSRRHLCSQYVITHATDLASMLRLHQSKNSTEYTADLVANSTTKISSCLLQTAGTFVLSCFVVALSVVGPFLVLEKLVLVPVA